MGSRRGEIDMAKRGPLPSGAYRGCVRKTKFVSQRVAEKTAKERTQLLGFGIYSYKCLYCKSWHLTRSKQTNET